MAAGIHTSVPGPETIHPTTITESIEMMLDTIDRVARKNEAMIELYVRPRPVPSEIAAHRAGLEKLAGRVDSLATLDITALSQVMDLATAWLAQSLLSVVTQLSNAIYGIQQIWINHYDSAFGQRKVYDILTQALDYKFKQLNNFIATANRDPSHRNVEGRVPATDHSSELSFCKGAIGLGNGRDSGKMAQVMSEDLTAAERAQVDSHSGAYLWWTCSYCAFKLKYYAPSQTQSSIHSIDDVRSHSGDGIGGVDLRKPWLIKCHLHLDKSKSSHKDNTGRGRYSTSADRAGVFNTSSAMTGSRRSKKYTFGSTNHGTNKKGVRHDDLDRRPAALPLYGCVLCFVIGAGPGRMDYQDEFELGRHIANKHGRRERLPCSLILERYSIGIDGKCSQPNRRWDLNIRLA